MGSFFLTAGGSATSVFSSRGTGGLGAIGLFRFFIQRAAPSAGMGACPGIGSANRTWSACHRSWSRTASMRCGLANGNGTGF